MKQRFSIFPLALVFAMAFAMIVWANVPPPPVNQQLGIDDGVFNNLAEADCRLCHEDPLIVDPGSIPDRHHLLVGTPIGDPNSAPFDDPPGNFECFSCHDVDCSTGVCDINVYRDCLFCHAQIAGDASVHHLTATAQGGDCVACHGDLVDNIGDGHQIPLYDPSLVTPKPSDGLGPNGRGACNFCHASGTGDPVVPGTDIDTGVLVYGNSATHHNTGLGLDTTKCLWCHDVIPPTTAALSIRTCEGCHGFESLHNIQVDSPAAANLGVIDPGAEDAYWGHIGNNDDCMGCHGGYTTTSAPGTGPVTPYISSSDVLVMTAGTDTVVTLSGTAFTNVIYGYEWVSDVLLTATDGTSMLITPDAISENSLTFTIPGSTATGNYEVRAVKGDVQSNPVVISIVPDVAITYMKCDTKRRLLTINGTNFMEQFSGAEDYINVAIDGVVTATSTWTDTQIIVPVTECRERPVATVSALYGSDEAKCGKGCVQKKRRRRR